MIGLWIVTIAAGTIVSVVGPVTNSLGECREVVWQLNQGERPKSIYVNNQYRCFYAPTNPLGAKPDAAWIRAEEHLDRLRRWQINPMVAQP